MWIANNHRNLDNSIQWGEKTTTTTTVSLEMDSFQTILRYLDMYVQHHVWFMYKSHYNLPDFEMELVALWWWWWWDVPATATTEKSHRKNKNQNEQIQIIAVHKLQVHFQFYSVRLLFFLLLRARLAL